MASAVLAGEPRPVKRSWNHPFHAHMLRKADTRLLYGSYGGLWRCDLCRREFKHQPETLMLSTPDSESVDHTHSYHCSQCVFDVCSQCYHGYLHPFHPHRLKRAKADLIYQDTEGQWKCDACQRVFIQVNAQQCYHCTECEVDLCERCFIGEWSHTLHNHSNHMLKPIDPRLEYRKFLSWLCDNCNRRFTFDNAEIMYHCSTCQFDLCTLCFKGQKHHLHEHGLVEVSRQDYGQANCSHCGRFITDMIYHQCVRPTCRFTLCTHCHVTPPRLHPSHTHPLSVCDPLEVYPQSGGLWHCDNCTSRHPSGDQTPLPSTQRMYHCEECDFDLCQSCYDNQSAGGRNVADSEIVVPFHRQLSQPPVEGLTNHRPLRYLTSPHSLTSLSPPISFITSTFKEFSLRNCAVCERYSATKFFVHGSRTCSEWAIACQGCADRVLLYSKPCPHCALIPSSVSNSALL